MAKINLLPWREELRKERQRFFIALGITVGVAFWSCFWGQIFVECVNRFAGARAIVLSRLSWIALISKFGRSTPQEEEGRVVGSYGSYPEPAR